MTSDVDEKVKEFIERGGNITICKPGHANATTAAPLYTKQPVVVKIDRKQLLREKEKRPDFSIDNLKPVD